CRPPVIPGFSLTSGGPGSDWFGKVACGSGGQSGGLAGSSRRPYSGAEEPAGVAGSRVVGVHHAVTRSALDAVRRRAESGAEGRRRKGDATERRFVHPTVLLVDHSPGSHRYTGPAKPSRLQFRRCVGCASSALGLGPVGPRLGSPRCHLVSHRGG